MEEQPDEGTKRLSGTKLADPSTNANNQSEMKSVHSGQEGIILLSLSLVVCVTAVFMPPVYWSLAKWVLVKNKYPASSELKSGQLAGHWTPLVSLAAVLRVDWAS